MNHTLSSTPSYAYEYAYTPLECLLLFQSLLSFGIRDEDFVRISYDLTNNELVRLEPTFQAQRLSVDALRKLCVRLLGEEVKTDGPEDVDDDGTPFGAKSRKKLSSPSFSMFKDLHQYRDKLPYMVDRLYAKYRDRMIQGIREDERRYAQLQKEIQEIESGKWDDKIQEEDREIARKKDSTPDGPLQPPNIKGFPSVSTPIEAPPTVQKQTEESKAPATATAQQFAAPLQPGPSPKIPPPPPPSTQAQPPRKSDGILLREVLNTPQPSHLSPPTKPPHPAPQQLQSPIQPPYPHAIPHAGETRPPSVPSHGLPSGPLNAPPNSSFNPPPSNGAAARPAPKRQPSNGPIQQTQPSPHSQPGQPGTQYQWRQEQPYPPSQQMQHPHYQTGSPQQQQQQQHYNIPKYPQYGPPTRGGFPPPHAFPPPNHHVPSSPSPLNSQHPSPINTQHPPPLNTQHSPHMQHQQGVILPPPNGMVRPPSSPGMPLDALAEMAGQQYRAPSGSPMTPQAQQMQPPPQGYHMQPPPMAHPIQYQQRPPSNGLPNGQPHGPPQWNQHFPPPQYHPPQGPYPPQFQSSPNPNPSSRVVYPPPAPLAPENRQYNSPYNANAAANISQSQTLPTSIPQTLSRPRPSQPNTPLNQKMFKYTTGSGTRWTPTPTPSTPGRDKIIMPPQTEPISPIAKAAPLPSTAKKQTKKEAPKSEPKKAARPRQSLQPVRAESTASSVVPESNRSLSVVSHVEDETANRHIKQEVATPIGVDDAGNTTADEFVALSKPARRTPQKRKRAVSIPESRPVSTPPTQVLWMRNFPKISQSALDGVAAHKNASMFAAPIKERDAPGYKDLILRPQDLKSIRSAIHAGQKAASAMQPADVNPSATNVWLPISEDLIPPKGIINNAQLEKELMRMFANAIMFNADPDRGFGRRLQDSKGKGDEVLGYEIDEDGVVKDTRAMFADVEKLVMELRSTERKSEERPRDVSLAEAAIDDDEDELAGDEGSVNFGSLAKRRRKG
jgi:hypothetical protein